MVRRYAEINPGQVPEALERKAAAGQQRQGQGKLGYHKGPASVASRSAGAGSSAQFEHFVEVESGGLPSRSRSKQQPRYRGNRNREEQDWNTDSDVRL